MDISLRVRVCVCCDGQSVAQSISVSVCLCMAWLVPGFAFAVREPSLEGLASALWPVGLVVPRFSALSSWRRCSFLFPNSPITFKHVLMEIAVGASLRGFGRARAVPCVFLAASILAALQVGAGPTGYGAAPPAVVGRFGRLPPDPGRVGGASLFLTASFGCAPFAASR